MHIPIEYTGNGAIVRLDDSMGSEPTIIRINARDEIVRITVHRVPKVDKFRKPLDEWEVVRREQYTFDSIADASPHIAGICGEVMESQDWGMQKRVAALVKQKIEQRETAFSAAIRGDVCLDF